MRNGAERSDSRKVHNHTHTDHHEVQLISSLPKQLLCLFPYSEETIKSTQIKK